MSTELKITELVLRTRYLLSVTQVTQISFIFRAQPYISMKVRYRKTKPQRYAEEVGTLQCRQRGSTEMNLQLVEVTLPGWHPILTSFRKAVFLFGKTLDPPT